MVGYQVNLATNSKMIQKSKANIFRIWNLSNFWMGDSYLFV